MEVYTVVVPFSTKEGAERTRKEIKEILKFDGFVIPEDFDVLSARLPDSEVKDE